MPRIPLLAITSGMVILALVGTALVMGLVSDRFSRLGITSLANKYVSELNHNIGSMSSGYLNTAATFIDLYSNQMAYDMESYHNFEFHRRMLYNIMKILPPYYEAVYFADDLDNFWYHTGATFYPSGYTYVVRSFPDNNNNIPSCDVTVANWTYENYPKDEDGFVGPWQCGWKRYLPSQRPWYRLISQGTEQLLRNPYRKAWSDVYLFAGHDQGLGYTLSRAVWRNDSGVRKFVGVAGIDSKAPYLTAFLSTLQITSNTLLYIMEEGGYMVATGKSYLPLAKTLPNGDQVPVMASEWSEARVRALYDKQGTRETGGIVQLDLDGRNHFVSIAKVDAPGQDRMTWRIVVAVPEDDFMGEVVEGRFISILSMCGLCLAVLMLCLAISYYIHRPVAILSDDMALIATMELDSIDETRHSTWIKEIQYIHVSFSKMLKNLQEFRTYIPPNVLYSINKGSNDDQELDLSLIERKESPTHVDSGFVSSKGSDTAAGGTKISTRRRNSGSHNFSRPLTQTKISVSSFVHKPREHDHHMIADNPDSYKELHSECISLLLSTSQRHQGVVANFFGDHVLVSYNAVKRCGAKGYHAVSTAIDYIRACPTGMCVSVGASSGYAHCGDLGSSSVRSFALLGPCVEEATVMHRLLPHETRGSRCLISATMYSECMSDFKLMCRDVVRYNRASSADNPEGVIVVMEVPYMVHTSESSASIPNDNEEPTEWMYGMDDDKLRHDYNEAVLNLLLMGNKHLMEAFIAAHEESSLMSTRFYLNQLSRMSMSVPPAVFSW